MVISTGQLHLQGLAVQTVSSRLSLRRPYVSRNLSFPLGCPICWHITVYSNLLLFFVPVVSVVVSPLSFIIFFIWVLSLYFLLSLAQTLIDFVSLSKTPAFGFMDLSYCFYLCFSYFLCGLYYFLPSAHLGLYCSSSFRW